MGMKGVGIDACVDASRVHPGPPSSTLAVLGSPSTVSRSPSVAFYRGNLSDSAIISRFDIRGVRKRNIIDEDSAGRARWHRGGVWVTFGFSVNPRFATIFNKKKKPRYNQRRIEITLKPL